MSISRTPKQMREDSSIWRRAGYPGVAVGRYRDAADQVERLERDVQTLAHIRDQLAARNESLVTMLCDILAGLPPEGVKLEDGRTLRFVDPDPRRTLEALQASIARARDAALERPRPDAEALAAVPSLRGAKALVLYFPTDADRDEFVALIHEAKPNMRSVKL